jgi:hypothetical protein
MPTMSVSRVRLAATSRVSWLARSRISRSSSRRRAMRQRATLARADGRSASSCSAAARDRSAVSCRQIRP